MTVPVLSTKLFIPPPANNAVSRPRLVQKLMNRQTAKLSLISASAGFGKTTLLSEWLAQEKSRAAWISLDREHSSSIRYFTYLIAAVQTLFPEFALKMQEILQSSSPPPSDQVLVHLINEISALPDSFILILDDYHLLESSEIDDLTGFLIENMPPVMHLVISTREDPRLPLSRLRARNQLIEIRVADLRFHRDEVTAYLNDKMGLDLDPVAMKALEIRSEGWITGLQLAAISLKETTDRNEFIRTFTGSHRFILDYLMDEVLDRQAPEIRSFLRSTSILERLCSSLCSQLLGQPEHRSREILQFLEQSNIFLIPLDEERRWYRYHHLFAELIRADRNAETSGKEEPAPLLHSRASRWFEDNGLYLEAFHHAVKAGDIEGAVRLIEGNGIPRTNRGIVKVLLDWLESLPDSVMDQNPLLQITRGSVLLGLGQVSGVEEILQKAENALGALPDSEANRDLHGRIASMRAIIAVTRYDGTLMKKLSLRALEYLHPENLSARTTALWTLGQSQEMSGSPGEAEASYTEAMKLGRVSGNHLFFLLSEAGLGELQEGETRLRLAAKTYEEVLRESGEHPLPVMSDVYLGLSRIHYQWNELDKALTYAESAHQLAEKFENIIDRRIPGEIFLARIHTALGETDKAEEILRNTSRTVQKDHFSHRMPDLISGRIHLLLMKGDVDAAAPLAEEHELNAELARIALIKGNPETALRMLEPLHAVLQKSAGGYQSLQTRILTGMARYRAGLKDKGVETIIDTFETTLAEGMIRIYLDEGNLIRPVLREACSRKNSVPGLENLMNAFALSQEDTGSGGLLSPREMEVLRLIAAGLTNREIGEKLFVALDTVKGHNRRIFEKLDVSTRTRAIRKAGSLGLL